MLPIEHGLRHSLFHSSIWSQVSRQRVSESKHSSTRGLVQTINGSELVTVVYSPHTLVRQHVLALVLTKTSSALRVTQTSSDSHRSRLQLVWHLRCAQPLRSSRLLPKHASSEENTLLKVITQGNPTLSSSSVSASAKSPSPSTHHLRTRKGKSPVDTRELNGDHYFC